jgi:hypothetical protein
MLSEAKLALRVTANAYDAEIASLLEAAVRDLQIAGVTVDGSVSISFDDQGNATDTSTITDKLVLRALFTYCRLHFGSPADYDRLAAAYETQKVQLMHAGDYTDYGEDDDG